MTELLTAEQMQRIEAEAFASGRTTGWDLMQVAAEGVVSALLRTCPMRLDRPRRALVLCGPGNNGGDGFCIARMLRARGWAADVFLFGKPQTLPPDARRAHDAWAAEGAVAAWDPAAIRAAPTPDVIVDALFGIGLTRALPDAVAEVLAPGGHPARTARRVAVDCPSGLDLDTGWVAGGVSLAPQDLTVTFHTPKIGHLAGDGPAICGDLAVVDLGLWADAPERSTPGQPPAPDRVRHVSPQRAGAPLPPRVWPLPRIGKAMRGGHKFDHGHALVFCGGVGRGGAGRMAARAALRVGAGLVTVLCPPAALQENACRLDAIMLRSVRAPEDLARLVDDRVRALCIGPGLGVSEATARMVETVLDLSRPSVLDADALTSFEDRPERLFARLHDRAVLTPHMGEFTRLFPDLAQDLAARTLGPVAAVRRAAARSGGVVLLKGESTIIASPGGAASVHAAIGRRRAPWLATAGAGDVLAGLVTGLAATDAPGGDMHTLAEIAAWLHVEAALSVGPGLIAEDLPDAIPDVLRRLGA